MNDESLVLVTGAPGWLGTRLVEALVRGLDDVPALASPHPERVVRCLVHASANEAALRTLGRVDTQVGDVTSRASVSALFRDARGATVFHAAGIIHPTHGTSEFRRVNVEGTKIIVDEAVRAGVRRLVFVSSTSPIGVSRSPTEVFDESSPYDPYMGYGRSKMLAELAVLDACATRSLEAVVVRVPWFYGPNQPARQSKFLEMIRDGSAPIVGGGGNRRSMVYIDNAVQGLLLASHADRASGGIYFVADRRSYTMNEIVDTIARVMEQDFGVRVKHRRLRLPGFVSEVACAADAALQAMGLYHPKIHVLSEINKTITCSIAKAEMELGYDPKVALDEGARRSIRWMLDHGGAL